MCLVQFHQAGFLWQQKETGLETHSQTLQGERSNWRTSLGPYLWRSGNPTKERDSLGDCRSQRGWSTSGEPAHLNQPSRVHLGTLRLKQSTRDRNGSAPGPLNLLCLLAWCFCKSPKSGSSCILHLFLPGL